MIAEAIHHITAQLPAGVRLVAVSKYHPTEAIREAFAAGQRLFGESHAQELQLKHAELAALESPEGCWQPGNPGGHTSLVHQENAEGQAPAGTLGPLEWHFIGHLQTNKVKYIAPYVSLIHSADSPHLLEAINRQALKVGRTIRCLLQLHVAEEETKFGFTPDEALAYLDSGAWQQLTGIQLAGVMAMATNTDDTARIRSDFHRARQFFERAQHDYFPTSAAKAPDIATPPTIAPAAPGAASAAPGTASATQVCSAGDGSPVAPTHTPIFSELSMGMSDDWHIAVDEGSTLIRIGTQIFGHRAYTA